MTTKVDLLKDWECPVEFETENWLRAAEKDAEALHREFEKYADKLTAAFNTKVKETANWAVEYIINETDLFCGLSTSKMVGKKFVDTGKMELYVSFGQNDEITKRFDFAECLAFEVECRIGGLGSKDPDRTDADAFLDKLQKLIDDNRA